MRLVDEKGVALPVRMGVEGFGVSYTDPASKSTKAVGISPDVSPLPLDVTQNWTYHANVSATYGSNFLAMVNGQSMPQQINFGRPFKLMVDFVVERREVVVLFEFTNLPLPRA